MKAIGTTQGSWGILNRTCDWSAHSRDHCEDMVLAVFSFDLYEKNMNMLGIQQIGTLTTHSGTQGNAIVVYNNEFCI